MKQKRKSRSPMAVLLALPVNRPKTIKMKKRYDRNVDKKKKDGYDYGHSRYGYNHIHQEKFNVYTLHDTSVVANGCSGTRHLVCRCDARTNRS